MTSDRTDKDRNNKGQRFFDPLFSRVGAYLATCMVPITSLEAAGTYGALAVFDQTLGIYRIPLAVAGGFVLFLSGHAFGGSLHAAVHEGKSRITVGALALAALVLSSAVLAIGWTADSRNANEHARAAGNEASQLTAEAGQLEQRAALLEAPTPAEERQVEPPKPEARRKAAALRKQVKHLQTRAATLDDEKRDGQTLSFLAAIQLVGLMAGAAAGWKFREATPLRHAYLLSKADKFRARDQEIVRDEAGSTQAAWGNFIVAMGLKGQKASDTELDLPDLNLPPRPGAGDEPGEGGELPAGEGTTAPPMTPVPASNDKPRQPLTS